MNAHYHLFNRGCRQAHCLNHLYTVKPRPPGTRGWEPVDMNLNSQLLSINLTYETLFVRFLTMCDFAHFNLYCLQFYCIVHMCDCHMYSTLTYLLTTVLLKGQKAILALSQQWHNGSHIFFENEIQQHMPWVKHSQEFSKLVINLFTVQQSTVYTECTTLHPELPYVTCHWPFVH